MRLAQQGKQAQLAKEVERLNMEIMGLDEVRLLNFDEHMDKFCFSLAYVANTLPAIGEWDSY